MIKTRFIEVDYSAKPGLLLLTVSSHRLINKFNKALGGYYPCSAKAGEEAIFHLNRESVAKLFSGVSNPRGTYLTQLLDQEFSVSPNPIASDRADSGVSV